MYDAEVGDDVFGEDPTVRRLEERISALFGHESALFCPTGTMANQIAIRTHTRPGQEVICHEDAHVYRYEGGGIMLNSQCSVRLLRGNRGRLMAADISPAVNNAQDIHQPVSRLVCVEDTANRGGGAVYDPAGLAQIRKVCDQLNMVLHLDGARVFNALTVTGIPSDEYGRLFHSLSVCLSKGLGAPVGSVLIGSHDFIHAARRVRKAMGGGMRQSGVLAAAGLYALEHHLTRLSEDHERASRLAKELAQCTWVADVFPPDTNIVIIRVQDGIQPATILAQLAEHHLLAVHFGGQLIRFVTHLDISDADIAKAGGIFRLLDQN